MLAKEGGPAGQLGLDRGHLCQTERSARQSYLLAFFGFASVLFFFL